MKMNYALLTIEHIEELRDVDIDWYIACDGDEQKAYVELQ